ncbi:CPBP family intramembrane glutamic endopeptidase [Treponema sp. R80B11-R83G3]
MGIYIEALILYILLFFPGSAFIFTNREAAVTNFSVTAGLVNIFTFLIPSLALIWYLIYKARKIELWAVKPGKKDIVSFVITLPCLLIIGLTVTFTGVYIGGYTSQITLQSPSSVIEWIVLSITCILAAYLEESYFRYYLLTKREELNLNATSALLLSVVLFSVCHIYEGPWGFMNAVISGTILGFIFLRYYSLHGIAIAHALYNISIYIINALVN